MERAFVLMRIFNPIIACQDKVDRGVNFNGNNQKGTLEQKFLERFERAIISVKINKGNLIVCDDTTNKNETEWKRHNININIILERHGFSKNNGNLFFTDMDNGGNGSSMAQWKLRKHFLKLTENIEGAFAVLLDQDDVLHKDAIKRISRKMKYNSIVISRFQIVGETERNIIGDGGKGHNLLIKSGVCLNNIIRMYPQKLSTIGWTKAYSRYAMSIMVDDFEKFFLGKGLCINDFFEKYRAYEDFLDFYMLLRKNISLRANGISHMYYKHADSITSRPNLMAFSNDRTTMLITLAEICSFHHNLLKCGWQNNLTNFLKIKIGEIEGILKKNREKAVNEDLIMIPFLDHTYEGWFAECMRRNSNNIYVVDAIENWKKKFYKSASVGQNLMEQILSFTRKILFLIFKYTFLRKLHMFLCSMFRNDNAYTPRQKQLKKNSIHLVIGVILIIFISLLFASYYYVDFDCNSIKWKSISADSYKKIIEIIGIFITITATFVSFMLEKRMHIEIKAEEETSLKKLYYSEFNDLIRHLNANLKVVIEIRMRMDNENYNAVPPMNIHFENLKWPENSTLFMEEVTAIIDKSKVDDFSRLRLNIRNMNNSAEWLRNYCSSDSYSSDKMKEMIDWEIWRMMAYYVNFLYMNDHNFNFPTHKQLDNYISYPEIKEKLYSLFMNIDDRDKIESFVAKYIGLYYKDRRVSRNVIFQ